MSKTLDSKKVNSELFTLTYGSLVTQLLSDLDDVEKVNASLEKMGFNIGVRLIEDYIARTNMERCYDLRETAEKIQSALKIYLGVSSTVGNWNAAGDEFSVSLDSNPLAEFVELPEQYSKLRYSNMLPGVIRGACEMVHLEVQCWFVQDQLRGDATSELRVRFVKRLMDSVPPGDD